MKQVALIYRNRENADVIDHIKKNLERVFEDNIQAHNYFLDELEEGRLLDADVFIVANEAMLYPLKNHIDNFYKIVLMNRSINRRYLPAILDIPKGTDVLVVNDSYETTIETTYAFYELGISHLNFIPYDEALDGAGTYRHIHTAITPEEPDLVPPYIENVLNIGYREVSFDTLLKVMHKLDLDLERTNRNLIRHIHSVVEANTDLHSNYLDSYLKSQMLNRVVHDSSSAILVVNDDYHLVYSNDKANSIFNIRQGASCQIDSFLDETSMAVIRESSSEESLLCIDGENYLLETSPIMIVDQLMGYCITLQNESDVRRIEINLNSRLREKGLYAKYHFHDIIHQSPAMKKCLSIAKTAAVTNYTILIRGESGTGKELLAQSLHNFSKRKNGPFVAVNCAALPESLLESELFGYEGGSFTGAHKNGKMGLFEQAHTGTIFLDEIGDVSPNLQSRLLRAIQEKQVMRIGSDKIIDVDIRIIAATNKDLEAEVQKGNFRRDLFYRLSVLPLRLEPLRRRREDILPLLSSFLGKDYEQVSDAEKELLLAYDWPGNVRELESTAIYYKTLASFPDHLNPESSFPDHLNPERIFPDHLHPERSFCHAPDEPELPASPIPYSAPPQDGRAETASPPNSNWDRLSLLTLQIISDHSDPYQGIGRLALLAQLKSKHVSIGDGRLRHLLADLQSKGLIVTRTGRRGSQITEKGAALLQSGKPIGNSPFRQSYL